MRNAVEYNGLELTRHLGQAPLYFGRTLKDWFWVYTFFSGMIFCLCLVYVRYLELFDSISHQSKAYQDFVFWFAGIPLVLIVPAVIGLLWWAGGFLTRYSRWQTRDPLVWRIFWIIVLLFFGFVELDLLDTIHPQMSHKGLGPIPDVIAMFETGYSFKSGIPMVQFQWGYTLLWGLLWFLLVVLHWQYVMDGLREAWFYIRRFNRYGASVLTGFRETDRARRRQPVTAGYPEIKPVLPPVYRGVPELNVAELTAAQAGRIIAADASGAITAAPDQPAVLFIDLGRFDHAPELLDLVDDNGVPLLRYGDWWAKPDTGRAALVVPLTRPVHSAARLDAPGGEA